MAPIARQTECHPDERHFAKGLCKRCYFREYLRANPSKRGKRRLPVTPEERQAYNRRHRAKKRQAVLDAYGNQCQCCGETQTIFLQIDHVNGGGNKDRKSGISDFTALAYKEGFPDKFRLLCANCNWGVYLNKGVCPHQVVA